MCLVFLAGRIGRVESGWGRAVLCRGMGDRAEAFGVSIHQPSFIHKQNRNWPTIPQLYVDAQFVGALFVFIY